MYHVLTSVIVFNSFIAQNTETRYIYISTLFAKDRFRSICLTNTMCLLTDQMAPTAGDEHSYGFRINECDEISKIGTQKGSSRSHYQSSFRNQCLCSHDERNGSIAGKQSNLSFHQPHRTCSRHLGLVELGCHPRRHAMKSYSHHCLSRTQLAFAYGPEARLLSFSSGPCLLLVLSSYVTFLPPYVFFLWLSFPSPVLFHISFVL